MDVIVIGAGQAGKHIAQVLSGESYNVTLIDADRERLEWAEESLDIRTICEHGANPHILEMAGAPRARLVAAVTDSDEVNLMPALQAKKTGVPRTIVAVKWNTWALTMRSVLAS